MRNVIERVHGHLTSTTTIGRESVTVSADGIAGGTVAAVGVILLAIAHARR
jgi:hypothetical protein